MRNELFIAPLLHLLDHQLGVPEDVTEGRAQIVQKIARQYVLNGFLDRPGKISHDPAFTGMTVTSPRAIRASILPSRRGSSIGFVS